MSFENTYMVKNIVNTHDVVCFCPLGKDYYSATVLIEIENPSYIMDYCDTDKFIDELSGQRLTIEDLTYQIAKHFKEITMAAEVVVASTVTNATHSPVEVTVAL